MSWATSCHYQPYTLHLAWAEGGGGHFSSRKDEQEVPFPIFMCQRGGELTSNFCSWTANISQSFCKAACACSQSAKFCSDKRAGSWGETTGAEGGSLSPQWSVWGAGNTPHSPPCQKGAAFPAEISTCAELPGGSYAPLSPYDAATYIPS